MNKNLEEISDGKRYGLNDMLRAACNDCSGCSSCLSLIHILISFAESSFFSPLLRATKAEMATFKAKNRASPNSFGLNVAISALVARRRGEKKLDSANRCV